MAVAAMRTAPVEILVGGAALGPAEVEQVTEVRVEQAVSLPDRAIVRLADPDLTITDGDLFAVGTTLQVKVGAPSDEQKPVEVFTGEVVTIEAEIGVGGKHVLAIALDKSHRLRRQTNTKAFNDVTVGDIAKTLAGRHALTVGKIDATGAPRQLVFQDGESDWELLERLSDEVGCDLDVDGGKLQLTERKASGAPVELELGETLTSFRPRLSGVAQVESVEVRAWDPTQKQAISETAKPAPAVSAQAGARNAAAGALGGGKLVVVDHPVESSAVAQTVAAAVADELASTVLEASAVAIGDPRIRAGGVVSLAGVGRRFGGEHRVVAATHVLRGRHGYETRFTLGAGGRPLVQELAGRARPGSFAAHLAIGLVTQNNDPQKQGRVKVKYPALDNQSESAWVRVAWPGAGKDRGVVALPQLGDEVVIGFEHGDIDRPLVLGALFNGKDTPGATLPAAASPQSVGVKLPGDFVTAVDGNVKTTAAKGIAMTSQGPVSVAASGEQAQLSITADAPIEITSKLEGKFSAQTTTIEGKELLTLTTNGVLQIKASGAIQVSGSAVAINSNGPLELKGMPVMLG